MLSIVEALLAGARTRQAEIEKAVFATPPSTMEGFQLQLGRWLELNQTVEWLQKQLDDLDKDEDET